MTGLPNTWVFHVSIILSALIVLGYIFLGGLTSAIYNEVLPFFLIVAGFAPLVFLGLKNVGGWSGLKANLPPDFVHAWSGMGRTPLIAAVPKMLFPFLVILPGLIALALTRPAQDPRSSFEERSAAAALHQGLTLPEGGVPGIKGGWIAVVNTYSSEMAQNFWTAIFAWTTCFLMTIIISLATTPRPDNELRGLVYALTERQHDESVAWYQRPVFFGIVVLGLTLLLNIIFF